MVRVVERQLQTISFSWQVHALDPKLFLCLASSVPSPSSELGAEYSHPDRRPLQNWGLFPVLLDPPMCPSLKSSIKFNFVGMSSAAVMSS